MSDFPDLSVEETKPEPPKRSGKKVVAKRISNIVKLQGIDYVRVFGNEERKWLQVDGSLQASYTISLTDFEKLKNA